MKNVVKALAVSFALVSATAQASVMYDGHLDFGGGQAVELHITTDGTLGALAQSNVLNWSFSFTNGITTENHLSIADGGDFGFTWFSGNAFIATGLNLVFDYNAVGHMQWDDFAVGGNDALCFGTVGAAATCTGGEPQAVYLYNSDLVSLSEKGSLILASASTNVPEPATLALMGLGLAGMGLSRRKAKKQ